jgi:hypothetical protein
MKAIDFLKENYDGFFDEFSKQEIQDILQAMEEYHKEQLTLTDVVASLPSKELPNCNRVEVIDQKGRSYVNWNPNNKVRLSMQDDGRTAKIFID